MELLVPATMIGFGSYFRKNAPKEINSTFGYRTTRSMKNRDTWEFAHNCCGKLWQRIGIALAPATIIAMLFSLGRSIDDIGRYGTVIIAIQTAVMIASIFPVESALKKTFDEYGRRRL